MSELKELLTWYDSLDPTFKFLFALPFIVAAVALIAEWVSTRRHKGVK